MTRILDDPLLTTILIVAALLALVSLAALAAPRIEVATLREVGRLFVGYKVPPVLVAFARRLLTALATLVVAWVAGATGTAEGADLAAVALAVAGLVELAGWGLLDQLRKGDQNDAPPRPPPMT